MADPSPIATAFILVKPKVDIDSFAKELARDANKAIVKANQSKDLKSLQIGVDVTQKSIAAVKKQLVAAGIKVPVTPVAAKGKTAVAATAASVKAPAKATGKTTVETVAAAVKAPAKATGTTTVDVVANKKQLTDSIKNIVANIKPTPVVDVVARLTKASAEQLKKQVGKVAPAVQTGAARRAAPAAQVDKPQKVITGAQVGKAVSASLQETGKAADTAKKSAKGFATELAKLGTVAAEVARAEEVVKSKTRDLTVLTIAARDATKAAADAETRRLAIIEKTVGLTDKEAKQARKAAGATSVAAQKAADTLTTRRDREQAAADKAAQKEADRISRRQAADKAATNAQKAVDKAAIDSKRVADKAAADAKKAADQQAAADKRAADQAAAKAQRLAAQQVASQKRLDAQVARSQTGASTLRTGRVDPRTQAQLAASRQVGEAQVALQRVAQRGSAEAAKVAVDATKIERARAAAVRDTAAAQKRLDAARKLDPGAAGRTKLIKDLERTLKLSKANEAELRRLSAAAGSLATQTDVARKIQGIPTAGRGVDTRLGQAQAREGAAARALAAADKEVELRKEALRKVSSAANKESLQSAAALQAEAAAALKVARAEREAAQSAESRGRRGRQAGRGVLATLASFAGLRAQVLAASTAFIAGTIAATAFSKAIGVFVGFETELNAFQATTGATALEMERVSASARTLGRDITLPGVSATDAANAMSELARAGLTVDQAMVGARGALQLATAAQIDNATAAQLVATALNAFSLSGEQAVHVADLLANAANAAQGSINDFGIAMQQVTAVASQVGVNLDDTLSLLTLLARAGLRGSDAGTSLRTAFLRLAAPTKDARKLIGDLGLQIRDMQGQLRPEVFAEFVQQTDDLSSNVQDAIASTIFGQDAIRAALLAGRAGVSGLQDVQRQLDQQGTAAKLAAARTKGLGGEAGSLKNNLEDLGLTIGSAVAPALKGLSHGVNLGLGALNRHLNQSDENRKKVEELRKEFVSLKLSIEDLDKLDISESMRQQVINPINFAAEALARLRESQSTPPSGTPGLPGFLDFPAKIKGLVGLESEVSDAGKRLAESQKKAGEETAKGFVDAHDRLQEFQDQLAQPTEVRLQLADIIDQLPADVQKAFQKTVDAIKEELPTALLSSKTASEQAATGFADANERLQQFHTTLLSTADASGRLNEALEIRATAQTLGDAIRSDILLLRKAGPGATGDEIDAAKQEIEAFSESLVRFGSVGVAVFNQVGASAKDLSKLGVDVAGVLSKDLAGALEDFTGVGDLLEPALSKDILDQIDLIASIPGGIAKLRVIGRKLGESLAEGVKDSKGKVKEAREALDDALVGRTDAIRESVDSARDNFFGLADSIESAAEQLIDVGPLQHKIDLVDKALEAFQKRTTQRELRFNLSQAQQELEDVRKTLVTVGPPSSAQKAQIAKALAPLKEGVAKAGDAITENRLEVQKDRLEDLKEAAKTAVKDGIQKVEKAFLSGKISAAKFGQELLTVVNPQLGILKTKAGQNLGLSFSRGFLADIDEMVQQAKFLVGFLGTPPPTRGVDPNQAIRDENKRVKDARTNLQEAIDAQKKTEQNTRELKPIRLALAAINKAIVQRGGLPVVIVPAKKPRAPDEVGHAN